MPKLIALAYLVFTSMSVIFFFFVLLHNKLLPTEQIKTPTYYRSEVKYCAPGFSAQSIKKTEIKMLARLSACLEALGKNPR